MSPDLSENEDLDYEIIFSEKNAINILPHDIEHMVITLRCDDWDI